MCDGDRIDNISMAFHSESLVDGGLERVRNGNGTNVPKFTIPSMPPTNKSFSIQGEGHSKNEIIMTL